MHVPHLAEETGARQTTVSHHLRLLRDAEWVVQQLCGRFTSTGSGPSRCAPSWSSWEPSPMWPRRPPIAGEPAEVHDAPWCGARSSAGSARAGPPEHGEGDSTYELFGLRPRPPPPRVSGRRLHRLRGRGMRGPPGRMCPPPHPHRTTATPRSRSSPQGGGCAVAPATPRRGPPASQREPDAHRAAVRMTRLLCIEGSASGISAALRTRELDPGACRWSVRSTAPSTSASTPQPRRSSPASASTS